MTGRNSNSQVAGSGLTPPRIVRSSAQGNRIGRLPSRRRAARLRALRSKRACRDARLIAFDLLGLNGEDLRRLPLHERRTRLERLIPPRESALWFSGHVEGPAGAALFRHACAMNLEGIVSKRIDTPYRSGPFLAWRKIKFPEYVRS